ncbi:hypothetical protein GDO78_006194 [Eleutherodactylus coqui]|uniref:Uncharacterized protein n=1 Tax=Eleutherodactylus coqui TaxID=57060 RepID=A0A8J6FMU6_ELECQ|nr:hypothetical protein GDO78_006194 [Eleutherodactylus coqui]
MSVGSRKVGFVFQWLFCHSLTVFTYPQIKWFMPLLNFFPVYLVKTFQVHHVCQEVHLLCMSAECLCGGYCKLLSYIKIHICTIMVGGIERGPTSLSQRTRKAGIG